MAFLDYMSEGSKTEFRLVEIRTSIGRSPECLLQIVDDVELSRVHCSVARQANGSFVVIDEGATNGTYLNDQRLGSEPILLRDQDVVRIGQTELVFRTRDVGRTTMLFSEVADEMESGKGFHTIMHEIVEKKDG